MNFYCIAQPIIENLCAMYCSAICTGLSIFQTTEKFKLLQSAKYSIDELIDTETGIRLTDRI